MGQNTMNGKSRSQVTSHKSQVDVESGFTLIELVIALSILAIILSFAEPIYRNSVIKAKEAALKKDIFVMRDSIDQYYADNSSYPQSLDDLVEKRYIRSIPEDPFTKSKDTWVIVSSAPEEVDVFDIHSGSDLLALDGTAYNEW